MAFDVPGSSLFREQGITAVTAVPDAAVWLAAWDVVLRYENGSWVRISSPPEGNDLPHVSSMAVSVNDTARLGFSISAAVFNKCGTRPDGSVWFGSFDRGVSRFDGQAWKSFVIP